MTEHKLSDMIRLYSNGGSMLLSMADRAERMEAALDAAKGQNAANRAMGGRPEEWHRSSPARRLHRALAVLEEQDA